MSRAAEKATIQDALVRLLWVRAADSVDAPIPFADVRNVLAADSGPDTPGWVPQPEPGDHFDSEEALLAATLTFLTSSPTPHWMGDLEASIDLLRDACEGQPLEVRRATLRHIARQGGQLNQGAQEIEQGFHRRLPFLAYLDHNHEASGPLFDVLSRSLEDTYTRSRSRVRHVLDATLGAAGFRPCVALFGESDEQQTRASEILSVLVTATYEGASMRADFDPLGRGFRLPTGPSGTPETWQLTGFAGHVFWSALATDAAVKPATYADLPPVEAPAPGYGSEPRDAVIVAASRALLDRMANAALTAPSFAEVQEALSEQRGGRPIDPSRFWNDYRDLWGDLVHRLALSESALVTTEWLAGVRATGDEAPLPVPSDPSWAAGPHTEESFSALVTEICRLAGLDDEASEDSRQSTSNRLTLLSYLEVMNSSGHGSVAGRVAVAEALEDGYLQLRVSSETTYRDAVEAAGARPNPAIFGDDEAGTDLAYEIMALLGHAIYEGLLLRSQVDPVVTDLTLPTAPDGSLQEWNLTGLAYLCIFKTCVELIPDHSV